MGRAAFEASVPATPSAFVLELHRVLEAERPQQPIDVTRLGTVVECRFHAGGEESRTVVRLHMAANSAGTVITAEAGASEYDHELSQMVERLVRRVVEGFATRR